MGTGIRAPAKINLTLEVLGRRDDGYHGIRSVMVPLELADEIAIEPGDRLALSCSVADLGGEENLALRAARAIAAAAGRELHANIVLSKTIPTKAGLGGGSSDAAAILTAAMDGRFGALPELDWLAIARALGSDVPFFLAHTAALVEGAGERVTALGATPPWAVLVVKPPVNTSTAQAYAALDARVRPTRQRADSISMRCAQALQGRDFAAVESLLSNDFTELAMRDPQIQRAAEALGAAGARTPSLAGSGSSLFALFLDAQARDAVAARLDLAPEFAVFRTAFARNAAWRDEARA